jgi:hypothetical protein
LNFTIGVLLFIAFIFLVTTGILMRYILPPGSGRHMVIWGMNRHDWGGIHFWISVVFFTLTALHLYRHWKWIVRMIKGEPGERTGIKTNLGFAGLAAIIAIAISPLFFPEKISTVHEISPAPVSFHNDIIIRGSMTLSDLENETGVPITYFLSTLNLPGDIPGNQRLGVLARRYNLEINDFRKAVNDYAEAGN